MWKTFFFVLFILTRLCFARDPIVWVWVGGYLAAPAYVGLGNALEAEHGKPDLIIASCGSSLAAVIFSLMPSAEERLEFLNSEEYRRLLMQFEPGNKTLTGIAAKVWEVLQDWRSTGTRSRYPNIYTGTLLTLADQFHSPSLDRSFSSGNIPVIIVGSRVYTPDKVGRRSDPKLPWVREAFFTDDKTAKKLEGFESPLAQIPGSRIPKEVEVITSNSMLGAARAAVTDLFLVNPTNEGLAGGMANLLPYDLARHIAGPKGLVIGTYRGDFNPLSEPVMQLMLGYSLTDVSRPANTRNDVLYVDFSTFQLWNKLHGFNFKLKRMGRDMHLQKSVTETTDPESITAKIVELYNTGHTAGLDFVNADGHPVIVNPISLTPDRKERILKNCWNYTSRVASLFPSLRRPLN